MKVMKISGTSTDLTHDITNFSRVKNEPNPLRTRLIRVEPVMSQLINFKYLIN